MSISIDLAFSIVKGIVKIGSRIDAIRSENIANTHPISLPSLYTEQFGAQDYLNALTKLGADQSLSDELRNEITEFVQNLSGQGAITQLRQFVEGHPDVAAQIERIQLEANLRTGNQIFTDAVRKLADRLSLDVTDEDVFTATLLVSAGESAGARQEWRIAMVVVDVLAEFSLENQHRYINDPETRELLGVFLERFSEGDLEDDIGGPKVLLQRSLSAAFNTLVDKRELIQADRKWVKSIFDALSEARDSVPQAQRDDYLVGLVKGKGYRILVGELIESGAEYLEDGDRVTFRDVAQDLLAETARIYQSADHSYTAKQFVNEHWGDIARAGLRSFSVHGEKLLEGDKPILRVSLLAAASSLGATEGRFSDESLVAATEAVIAAVAADPDIMGGDSTWANEFFATFAGVVAADDVGLRRAFSAEGIDRLVRDAMLRVAEQPSLITSDSGLGAALVSSILSGISKSPNLHAEDIANATVAGAFDALAKHPQVVSRRYGDAVGQVSARLSKLVAQNKLNGVQASHLAGVATEAIASVAASVADDLAQDADWGEALFVAFADTVAEVGIVSTFSGDALDNMLKNTLQVIAAHPEVVVSSGEQERQFLKSILDKVARVERFNGERIASAALDGALKVVADNPTLFSGKFPQVVGDIATNLAEMVRDGKLRQLEAIGLVDIASRALASNPALLVDVQDNIAAKIIACVVDVAERDESNLLTGVSLTRLAGKLLSIVAARGKLLLDDDGVTGLVERLGHVLQKAVAQAGQELGERVDTSSAVTSIEAVMEAWSRGQLSEMDMEEEAFKALFASIANRVQQALEHLPPDQS